MTLPSFESARARVSSPTCLDRNLWGGGSPRRQEEVVVGHGRSEARRPAAAAGRKRTQRELKIARVREGAGRALLERLGHLAVDEGSRRREGVGGVLELLEGLQLDHLLGRGDAGRGAFRGKSTGGINHTATNYPRDALARIHYGGTRLADSDRDDSSVQAIRQGLREVAPANQPQHEGAPRPRYHATPSRGNSCAPDVRWAARERASLWCVPSLPHSLSQTLSGGPESVGGPD